MVASDKSKIHEKFDCVGSKCRCFEPSDFEQLLCTVPAFRVVFFGVSFWLLRFFFISMYLFLFFNLFFVFPFTCFFPFAALQCLFIVF